MYQGHLADGSSVQRHSAGPVYPFVVYGRTVAGEMHWEVQGPGVEDFIRFEHSYDAAACANNLKTAFDSLEHWTRQMRALTRMPDELAAKGLAILHGFTQVHTSGVQRVRALLYFGKSQGALNQLRGQHHHPFTEYAYRMTRESRDVHGAPLSDPHAAPSVIFAAPEPDTPTFGETVSVLLYLLGQSNTVLPGNNGALIKAKDLVARFNNQFPTN